MKMGYRALYDMFQSNSLRDRIIAAAAKEGVANPDQFRESKWMWKVMARSDWEAAWDGALQSLPSRVYNPDTGERPDVITDQMILTVVQSLKAQMPTAAGARSTQTDEGDEEAPGEMTEVQQRVQEGKATGQARKAAVQAAK